MEPAGFGAPFPSLEFTANGMTKVGDSEALCAGGRCSYAGLGAPTPAGIETEDHAACDMNNCAAYDSRQHRLNK